MLVNCVGCRRHVRAGETRCPFCGSDRVPSEPIRTGAIPAGRLSRAAIATLTLAGAQAIACRFEDPPALVTHYGCPPPCAVPPPVIVTDAGPTTPRLPIKPRDSDASASKTGKARDAAAEASGANVDAEHRDAGGLDDAVSDGGADQ